MLLPLALLPLAAAIVFPEPQHWTASGPPLPVGRLTLTSPHDSARLQRVLARYQPHLAAVAGGEAGPAVEVEVRLSPADTPEAARLRAADEQGVSSSTCYGYALTVSADPPRVDVEACSAFAAGYALESLLQLAQGGRLPHSRIEIRDAPQYAWRGLMLDAGRRFFPVPLVKNLLDTMAAVKLNVLHLHVSDMCRFGVESKLFPNLTATLVGTQGGFYTQDDVHDLVAYAADRGVRVVPEFDVPGHARGMLPIEGKVHFCSEDATRNQLYNDPQGETYGAVRALIGEMAALFPDEVLHLGCDETGVKGPCSLDSTFGFERKLSSAVASELNKTAAGWEEIAFDAGAATQQTIVYAWTGHTAKDVTATGRRAVESRSSAFYFTEAARGGPEGWARSWYDIATGVPANETNLLLGGEMSMWSDTYCFTEQCGASDGPAPVAAALFPPARDEEFGKSIGGMIWPRGFVGAHAFWNFASDVDPASDKFTAAVWRLNDQLRHRGSYTCPSNCSCDQLSACGRPYEQTQGILV